MVRLCPGWHRLLELIHLGEFVWGKDSLNAPVFGLGECDQVLLSPQFPLANDRDQR